MSKLEYLSLCSALPQIFMYDLNTNIQLSTFLKNYKIIAFSRLKVSELNMRALLSGGIMFSDAHKHDVTGRPNVDLDSRMN